MNARRLKGSLLFEDNRDLAVRIACSMAKHLGGFSLKDLKAFALEGLWEATRSYEPLSGIPFRAYAKFRIEGAVLDEKRKRSPIGRRLSADVFAVELEENINPDLKPLADELIEEKRELTACIAIIEGLPPRERRLLRGHYLLGKRFDHVAAGMGLSKSWASRIHAAGLARLKKRVALERGL